MATFSCDSGANLRGSRSIHCDGHNWNDSLPICSGGSQIQIQCDDKRQKQNIFVKFIPNQDNVKICSQNHSALHFGHCDCSVFAMFFFPLILGSAKMITNLLKIDIFLKDGPESLSVEGPRSINGKEEVKLKCSSPPSNRVVRWETTLFKYI